MHEKYDYKYGKFWRKLEHFLWMTFVALQIFELSLRLFIFFNSVA